MSIFTHWLYRTNIAVGLYLALSGSFAVTILSLYSRINLPICEMKGNDSHWILTVRNQLWYYGWQTTLLYMYMYKQDCTNRIFTSYMCLLYLQIIVILWVNFTYLHEFSVILDSSLFTIEYCTIAILLFSHHSKFQFDLFFQYCWSV